MFQVPRLLPLLIEWCSTPVGGWDVMASNGNPPQIPSAFTQWKYFDWGEIPEITRVELTLNPTYSEGNSFKISSPNSESEYFVLEYRTQVGMYEEKYLEIDQV